MAMAETMAHETAHMIYFHRKFLLNDQPSGAENIYLNEGLAALAQDLTGMTGGNFFVMKEGLDSVEDFAGVDIMSDFGGYELARDGVLRGGAYLFLRYLYDQAGGDRADGGNAFTDRGGIAWLHGYVDSRDKGVVNVQGRMEGKLINDILFDYYTALILSNRGEDSAPISDDPRFNFLPTQTDPVTDRTRGADMFGSFREMMTATGPEWAYVDNSDGAILSTGVQYLVIDAAAAGDIVVTLQVDPRAEPLLRVARLK
jgi:hypothetical protein